MRYGLALTVLLWWSTTAIGCRSMTRAIKDSARSIDHLAVTVEREVGPTMAAIRETAAAMQSDAETREKATGTFGAILDQWKEALGLLALLVVWMLRRRIASLLGGQEVRQALRNGRGQSSPSPASGSSPSGSS